MMGGFISLIFTSATARRFAMLAALIFTVALARPASASDPLATLDGNHPDEASDIVGAAPASPSNPLAMRLTLALRNRADLSRLLAAQQDPSSVDYHRWLTPDEFTARFGPTAADLARVARFLTQKGFTVTSADASTREVNFTGTVAQAQNVFAVKIAATAVFCLVVAWNEFLFALILTQTETAMTLPVGIASRVTQYEIRWGEMSAAGVVAMLPVLVFATAAQKYLVRGLSLGAVKG